MKFYILNDVHIEFETFDPPNVDADAIILAGDIHVKNKGLIWAKEKFLEKPVIYVMGNHEFYGCAYPRQIEKLKDQASGTNVQILENETTKVGDVYILCCTLWTDFDLFGNPRMSGYEASQNMTDYKKIRVSPDTTNFVH